MKWVRQKHRTGCGPACLAMIAGVSYEQALRFVHPRRRKGSTVATSVAKLVRGIRRAGLFWHIEQSLSFAAVVKLREPAVVAIRWAPSRGDKRHWIVWDPVAKRFSDPLTMKSRPPQSYRKAYERSAFARAFSPYMVVLVRTSR